MTLLVVTLLLGNAFLFTLLLWGREEAGEGGFLGGRLWYWLCNWRVLEPRRRRDVSLES
jgi:hypothetical protein